MTRRWWLLACAALVVAARCSCDGGDPPATRVVTFNIEHFPRDARQVAAAFDELVATRAQVVAVQEITDPALFAATARRRLGPTWQLAHDTPRVDNHHHLGVLFDGAAWHLGAVGEHDTTRIGPLDLPVLDVRLVPLAGGDAGALRVLVVHFRPGTSGRAARAEQHAALAAIADAAVRTGDRVVVLGDFNATEDADRDDLARLARSSGLHWASSAVLCTAFWDRADGCPRSRLDQILTSEPARSAQVGGGCARHGCDWEASCPAYAHEVSDHCPVIVDF